MDFAWVVDALRRGLKVTRKAWAGDPPIYLYRSKTLKGDGIIMKSNGTRRDFEWKPTGEDILDITDWEEYVEPKKEPDYTTKLPFIITEQDFPGGKPVEELDLDAETNKAIALVARNIAENLVELLRNPSVQRILQKTDVPLSKEDTNHV